MNVLLFALWLAIVVCSLHLVQAALEYQHAKASHVLQATAIIVAVMVVIG